MVLPTAQTLFEHDNAATPANAWTIGLLQIVPCLRIRSLLMSHFDGLHPGNQPMSVGADGNNCRRRLTSASCDKHHAHRGRAVAFTQPEVLQQPPMHGHQDEVEVAKPALSSKKYTYKHTQGEIQLRKRRQC